ncbi:MAG: hypothetical protein A3E78_15720 [Alphaproteobacteria bacterium RIFCSPHIGHO2_12_FULL_63_12]|nr:MAG: hypothetical protein A3E78_15720 [Alphaproteobacteria bacterium RIFCSPHIGHO2_12_FULL_63_12]
MGVFDLFSVLKFRKLILIWATAVGLGVGVLLGVVLPTKYLSAAKVQVDSLQRNELTGLIEPRVRVGEYLGQQAAIASSRTVAIEVIDQLSKDGFIVLSDFEELWRNETGGESVVGNDLHLWAADRLLRDLSVTSNEIESTLELGFRAEDPSQAARVANAFASAYMSTVLDKKQRQSARRAASFSDETQELADGVADAQNDLAAFREKTGVLPLGQYKTESAEVELSAVTERLAQARADNAEEQSLLRRAEALPKSAMISFPLPFEATSARESQERLIAVAPVVARLAERYGPKYPDYIEAAQEKATLENDILRAVRERAELAAGRVAALEAQAARLKSEFMDMQQTRQAYDLLEDKVSASQDTYNLVTTRTLQETLQSRVDSIDVFLLSRATPPSDPVTLSIWLVALIGAFAGAALGAAVAVFVELYEGRIRSMETVRQSFRTQIVAEIAPAALGRKRKHFKLRLAS